MKNGIYLFLYLCLSTADLIARTEAEQIIVDLINQKLSTADLSVVTASNREAIVKILRDAATFKITTIGTSSMDAGGAGVILMRLNDTETITRLIGQYRSTYGSRGSFWLAEHLEWAGQASVIPLLAADFFLQDGDQGKIIREGKGEGLHVIPRSAFSGITALRVTIASKQFSDETRAWANQRLMQDCYPYDKFRAEMRLWWRQNKGAFDKADYKAVNPLKPEKAIAVIAPPSPPPLPLTPTTNPPILIPKPMLTLVRNEPAVVKSAPAPPTKQYKSAWMWFAVIFSVVTGAVMAWRFRK